MKDLAIKVGLSVSLQVVNAGAIYMAVTHMKLVQNGGATSGDTLLIVAGLFILAKANFAMSKFVKSNQSIQAVATA